MEAVLIAPSPIPLLLVLVVTNVFAGLITGTNIVEQRFNEIADPTEQEDCGFFCSDALQIVGAIISAVWAVVLIIFDFLTFNIADAPTWLRAMISLPVSGTLIWSVVSLIRGN